MDLLLHEFGRNFGDALRTCLRPAFLDRDGATFNPTEFTQSLGKSSAPRIGYSVSANEYERNGRPLARLLPPRDKRARDRYAAKKRKEFAPSHRIRRPLSND